MKITNFEKFDNPRTIFDKSLKPKTSGFTLNERGCVSNPF